MELCRDDGGKNNGAEVDTTSPVQSLLNNLDAEIGHLAEVVDLLKEKLYFILTPADKTALDPMKTLEEPKQISISPIEEQLHKKLQDVIVIRVAVQQIQKQLRV